jgi:lipoprotein-anchoring transpeptidase ErfK/SrfK
MRFKGLYLAAASAAVLVACGQPQPAKPPAPTPTPAQPANLPAPGPGGPLNAQTVDQAAFSAEAVQSPDRAPSVVRAQVLLDRARFSPGMIDGTMGENVRQAIAAYEEANSLPVDGQLDEAVFAKLTQTDTAPSLTQYVITDKDVAGPYVQIPKDDLKGQSLLPALGYQNITEALAERFHMTEELLQALNPGVDFNAAGTAITVAAVSDGKLPTQVASIEVDKQEKAVRALDKDGNLIAFYPATIGSEEMPAPAGVWKVTGVAHAPDFTFDPKRLTYKKKGVNERVTVKPGPNNPVGAVWIDLSKDTYGIHGTPEPREVGKASSHGCVRLTNWDVAELASGVKTGAKVSFLEKSTDSAMRKAAAPAAAKAT